MVRGAVKVAALAGAISTVTAFPQPDKGYELPYSSSDPFAAPDVQKWVSAPSLPPSFFETLTLIASQVNPDDMTWNDWKDPPATNWADPSRKGSSRNFNIAMVLVDYPDKNFTVTLPPKSDVYGNPFPEAAGLKREDVPAFYRDFLNKPNELNKGHTLHEYWMGDSFGKYGVDLTVFGAYRLPKKFWQYGIDDQEGEFNEGACPGPEPCQIELRNDALTAWRQDVGSEKATSFELVFILSAGQDESSTWQEFGEMKFLTKEDVPEEFGPPNNETLPNWAKTRYVEWTSWQAASNIWPNAGGGSSTQGESSGMATFAHELSHLLGIGDNYNNPYGTPQRRAYSGPFSMLDRGSFNGPGGPHTRWQIPPTQGASMGSLHTMRDKHFIGLIDDTAILQLSRDALAKSGIVVGEVTARAVDPGTTGLMGFNITLPTDLSPKCNTSADPLCDGGGYNAYNIEVVDRMGADSFCPDAGVMISKSKFGRAPQPFQWVIDANPQDIDIVDFVRPDGTEKKYTIGDYRQLSDALFHAGLGSGSQFEHVDKDNKLHLYVVEKKREGSGTLKYVVGARSLAGTKSPHTHAVKVSKDKKSWRKYVEKNDRSTQAFTFTVQNSGKFSSAATGHHAQEQRGKSLEKNLRYDIYRVEATVEPAHPGKGNEDAVEGWEAVVMNPLIAVEFGKGVDVDVGVRVADQGDKKKGKPQKAVRVVLTVTSESDPEVQWVEKWEVKGQEFRN